MIWMNVKMKWHEVVEEDWKIERVGEMKLWKRQNPEKNYLKNLYYALQNCLPEDTKSITRDSSKDRQAVLRFVRRDDFLCLTSWVVVYSIILYFIHAFSFTFATRWNRYRSLLFCTCRIFFGIFPHFSDFVKCRNYIEIFKWTKNSSTNFLFILKVQYNLYSSHLII